MTHPDLPPLDPDAPTALHLFCGMGGGALGFRRAGFRSVGAVDCDPAAIADLEYLTGEPGTVADLGALTPEELRAISPECPDVVFTSPPCKAFSGCLPLKTSRSTKYVEMSSLALRGVWLALEAWAPRLPKLILLENVPRIQSRGQRWLEQLKALLVSYGYAVHGSSHDCGVLGGLAQHRRRYLLVARHKEQVPEWLYQPLPRRVRGVGEVLSALPVPKPDSEAGGPLHRLPRMSPLNWLRLALIPPGQDWRALPERVALPTRAARQNGQLGVNTWEDGSHAVIATSQPSVWWSSVADPRLQCQPRNGAYGVEGWQGASCTVIAAACHDNSSLSVADPRITTPKGRREGAMGVKGWDEPSTTVIAQGIPQNGPWQVADPRLTYNPHAGTRAVVGWAEPTHTIIAAARSEKGCNVADPRLPLVVGDPLDLDTKRACYVVIRAEDGCWHRPMTTLELAALQGFPTKVRGEWLKLDGGSHKGWRGRIGNAVPPPTAEAIARQCLITLRASARGEFLMSAAPVWVDGPAVQGGPR